MNNKETIVAALHSRFAGKKVLIWGLGREGKASFDFLAANFRQLELETLAVSDLNPEPCVECLEKAEAYGIAVSSYSAAAYPPDLSQFDLVLKSPGISCKNYVYEAKVTAENSFSAPRLQIAPQTEITCQVDLFLQIYGQQTVAVTGTKGKSTTTSLLYRLLDCAEQKSALLGNIGIAAFSRIFDLGKDVAALELSCHQLEFTTHTAKVALLTNLYPEHLDHYHNLEEYYQSKINLIRQPAGRQWVILPAYEDNLLQRAVPVLQQEQYVFYLCRNQNDLANLQKYYDVLPRQELKKKAYIFTFSAEKNELTFSGISLENCSENAEQSNAAAFEENSWNKCTLQFSAQLQILHMKLDSVLAVMATFAYYCEQKIAAGRSLVLPELWAEFQAEQKEHIISCLREFTGLDHRLQYVGTYGGHPVYNDSICTIPLAAIKALTALPQCRTIILGGLDRGLDYTELYDFLKQHEYNVIGLPTTGHTLTAQLAVGASAAELKRYYQAKDMAEAVNLAYKITAPGKGILLSPAAASYNTYKNFEERGRCFVAEIKRQAPVSGAETK